MTFPKFHISFPMPCLFHSSPFNFTSADTGIDDKCSGSLTIYFALIFAVMVSLITACIYSAKVEAGRARTANAADQAIFSLFANYDQSLFNQYQIFMIDGSCGTDHLSTLTLCNTLAENADYLLQPKKGHFLSSGSELLSLKQTGCSITGYTLATDLYGLPFRTQAIQSEKDTLGLSKKRSQSQNQSSNAADMEFSKELSGSTAGTALPQEDANRSFTDYPTPDPNHHKTDDSSEAGAEISVPSDFKNPLPILETLRRQSLLPLVIDEARHPISDASVSNASHLVSQRNLERGFGIIHAEGSSLNATDSLFFQTYLMQHFFCFTDSFAVDSTGPDFSRHSHNDSGLSYELEYLIAEKGTDKENLKKVAQKLLLQREGINFMYLQTDPGKHSEISQGSLLIAASIGFPELEPAIEGLLSLAWAFAESLVDLSSLFDGKRIAPVKSSTTWQTDFSDLPKLTGGTSSFVKDVPKGLSYRDCLKVLLSQKLLSKKSTDRLTLHAMDLIELNMQSEGRPHFRLDRCIDSLSFELSVTSERKIPLTAESSFSYRSGS